MFGALHINVLTSVDISLPGTFRHAGPQGALFLPLSMPFLVLSEERRARIVQVHGKSMILP